MKRILIVEDNLSDLKILLHIVRGVGFEGMEVSDPYRALELLGEFKFDLVVLDWMMPRMSGLGVLRQIRKNGQNSKTPVIFVTGKSDAKDIKEAISEGITDYLIKPIDKMVLEGKIARALSNEDDWAMFDIPKEIGIRSQLNVVTEVRGLSEIGVQFFSSITLKVGEMFGLNLAFLEDVGITNIMIRVQKIAEDKGGFVIEGTFVGMKEKEMRAIRMFLKDRTVVVNNRFSKLNAI